MDKWKHRSRSLLTLVICLAVILCVTIFSSKNGSVIITQQINEDMLGIACGGESCFVMYDDISDISLQDTLTPGETVSCTETDDVWYGTFQSDTLGQYKLYAYKNTDAFIVIRYVDGVLAFNCTNIEKTQDTLDQLLNFWQSQS